MFYWAQDDDNCAPWRCMTKIQWTGSGWRCQTCGKTS